MEKKLHLGAIGWTVIAVFSLTTWVAAQTSLTHDVGPYRPHEVRDAAVSKPGSTQKLYAADAETLKYSTDGGSNWSVTSTAMLNPKVVAVSQADVNLVHVGKDGELQRSTNGGSDWSQKLTVSNLVPLRLVVSPSNGSYWLYGTNTVYSGGVWTRSVYRTSNGGTDWSGIDYFKDNAHTQANAVLYHTTDNAKAWVGGSRLNANSTPDMTDESSYCPTCQDKPTKGVWYSSDAGVNWSFKALQNATDRNVTAMTFSKSGSSEIVFAATKWLDGSTVKAKLYQSTDAGTTWTVSADLYTQGSIAHVRALEVSPVNHNVIAAATDRGFAVSTNRGVNWVLENTDLGSLGAAYRAVFDKDDGAGNTLYLATYPTVYKTTNAGANWSPDQGSYSWMNTSGVSARGGMAHGVSQVYSGIGGRLGGSWNRLPKIVGKGSFAGEATAINFTDSLYASSCGDSAGYGAIYTRSDGGDGWGRHFVSSAASTKLYSIVADHKSNSTRVYSGGKVSVSGVAKNFLYSTNKGSSWLAGGIVGADAGVPVLTVAVDASTGSTYSTTLYAGLGSGAGVRKSTDGGSSWPTARLNGNSISAIALNSSASGTVYLGSTSYVWKSTNSLGSEPSQLSPPFTGAAKLLMHPSYPSSANHLWAITGDGTQIYKTVNGGTSWVEISTSGLPTPFRDLRTDPTSNALIYVAGAGGVYKINPVPEMPANFVVTGSTCTGCSEAPSCNPKASWTANTEADLDAAGKYVVERSVGGTGNPIQIATTNNAYYVDNSYDVDCNGTLLVYYRVKAKDVGGGYSLATGWASIRVVDPNPMAEHRDVPAEDVLEFRLFQNTPNPFNPTTSITYSLAEDVHVSLKIYDVIGREAATLVDGMQSAGVRTVSFDGGQLPSGVYFYRIVAGRFTDFKKLLILK